MKKAAHYLLKNAQLPVTTDLKYNTKNIPFIAWKKNLAKALPEIYACMTFK